MDSNNNNSNNNINNTNNSSSSSSPPNSHHHQEKQETLVHDLTDSESYTKFKIYAADKNKYQLIDPNYKRPKAFELWEQFSLCNFQKLPSFGLTEVEQPKAPCRGLMRRITDIMEDSYFLYHQYTNKKQ